MKVKIFYHDNRLRIYAVIFVGLLLVLAGSAHAASVKIVALGASNTAGQGVGSSEAWPARLAALLRAKGYDVSMTIDAVSGDTSAGIANRAAAIPAGTQVVLFDTGTYNDRRRGVTGAMRQANIGQIESLIRAHGATPIRVTYLQIPSSLRQPDGIHLNAAGHARIAAGLLPRVITVIGKRR